MIRRLALALSCLVALSACETPAGPPLGASVQAVEATRFQVTYRGVSRMQEAEVKDRALMQAARLTLDHGFDWFQVAGRVVAGAPPTTPRFSLGIGGLGFGGHTAVGVGASTHVGGEASYVASLEIVLGKGPKPRGPDAYDAHDVAATLGARLH